MTANERHRGSERHGDSEGGGGGKESRMLVSGKQQLARKFHCTRVFPFRASAPLMSAVQPRARSRKAQSCFIRPRSSTVVGGTGKGDGVAMGIDILSVSQFPFLRKNRNKLSANASIYRDRLVRGNLVARKCMFLLI